MVDRVEIRQFTVVRPPSSERVLRVVEALQDGDLLDTLLRDSAEGAPSDPLEVRVAVEGTKRLTRGRVKITGDTEEGVPIAIVAYADPGAPATASMVVTTPETPGDGPE